MSQEPEVSPSILCNGLCAALTELDYLQQESLVRVYGFIGVGDEDGAYNEVWVTLTRLSRAVAAVKAVWYDVPVAEDDAA